MSLSLFDVLAERRILEAIRGGELDDLPGEGKPLTFDDEEPLLPVEQRIANRILKNAGIMPAEVGLRRKIASLRTRIPTLRGEARRRMTHRLSLLMLRLGEMRH